jgi:hypothetical protein
VKTSNLNCCVDGFQYTVLNDTQEDATRKDYHMRFEALVAINENNMVLCDMAQCNLIGWRNNLTSRSVSSVLKMEASDFSEILKPEEGSRRFIRSV